MGSLQFVHLSIFTIVIFLHPGTSILEEPDSVNVDPATLSDFVSSYTNTLHRFLGEDSFPSRQQCMRTMCEPRTEQSFPFRVKGYGSRACGMQWPIESPLESFRPPQKDPKYVLEGIRRSLGEGSSFIYDNNGEVIGILPPETDREESRPGRPGPAGTSTPDNGDDVDVCCKTREAFFINTTLVDIYGIRRTIAQFSVVGSYQFIRHGLCGSSGSCPGVCVPQYVTVPLAIHPFANNQLVSFSFFKVPGYCTCRVPISLGR